MATRGTDRTRRTGNARITLQALRYRGAAQCRRTGRTCSDRIDLSVDVPALVATDLAPGPLRGDAATSADVRARVTAARERQQARQGKPNARLTPADVGGHCATDAAYRWPLRRRMPCGIRGLETATQRVYAISGPAWFGRLAEGAQRRAALA